MSITAGPARRASIWLTGGFELNLDGVRRVVPHSVERLLGYLALTDGPVRRCRLAADLWYDATDAKAACNLRTAVWRLRKVADWLIVGERDRIALSSAVMVEARPSADLTEGLITGCHGTNPAAVARLRESPDLLPSWSDPWVTVERERLRLLRLAAFESAAESFLDQGRSNEALLVALEIVRVEPLRESAQRIVVRIHLADGNVADALHTYRDYRRLLDEELRLRPSSLMLDLIAPILTRTPAGLHALK